MISPGLFHDVTSSGSTNPSGPDDPEQNDRPGIGRSSGFADAGLALASIPSIATAAKPAMTLRLMMVLPVVPSLDGLAIRVGP